MDMGARTSSLGRAVLRAFVYNGLPTRVVFGIGSIRNLPAEVERLGARLVLMISTPGRAEPLDFSREVPDRSEEHTSELQSQFHLVCRLLLEKKKKNMIK